MSGGGEGAMAQPPPLPPELTVPPQLLETQTALREKEVEALRAQGEALSGAGGGAAALRAEVRAVQEQFEALREPLRERRRRLMASKEEQQFQRHLQDEIVSGGRGGGRGDGKGRPNRFCRPLSCKDPSNPTQPIL